MLEYSLASPEFLCLAGFFLVFEACVTLSMAKMFVVPSSSIKTIVRWMLAMRNGHAVHDCSSLDLFFFNIIGDHIQNGLPERRSFLL